MCTCGSLHTRTQPEAVAGKAILTGLLGWDASFFLPLRRAALLPVLPGSGLPCCLLLPIAPCWSSAWSILGVASNSSTPIVELLLLFECCYFEPLGSKNGLEHLVFRHAFKSSNTFLAHLFQSICSSWDCFLHFTRTCSWPCPMYCMLLFCLWQLSVLCPQPSIVPLGVS